MDGIEADNASSIRASSRSRMPNSLQDQEGVVREKLNVLKRSAGGYVATMSKVCARIDDLLADFANLVQVRNSAKNEMFTSDITVNIQVI